MPDVTQLSFIRFSPKEKMESFIERVNQRMFYKDNVNIHLIFDNDAFGRSIFVGILIQFITHKPIKDAKERDLDNEAEKLFEKRY